MIYEFPDAAEPIRQGDVFSGVPRVDFSLEEIPVVKDYGAESYSWAEMAAEKVPFGAIVAMRPVTAIVASQDCDAVRAPDVTLCEIRSFKEIEKKCESTKSPKSWVSIITQQAQINQKWFYLPPDPKIGFKDKMGVDFLVTIRVCREELEGLRRLRMCRLNSVALQHFRERISAFFRRYPVDEWYALVPPELTEYRKDHPDAIPFPWQSDEE